MPSYVRTVCAAPVPAGTAHVRSSMFVPVAWCGPCWVGRVRIPAQRQPEPTRMETR